MNTLKKIYAVAWFSILLAALTASTPFVQAGNGLTEGSFRALILELSPKVNFFRDYWKKDPNAVFVGGPVRDFSLWVRGRLARAEAKGKLAEEIEALKKLSSIDVRDFMDPESDLDIITKRPIQLSGIQYGVGKAEQIDPDRFVYSTPAGRDEVLQGFIPIEKIRLGQGTLETRFGRPGQEVDALSEIVARKYTAVFPIEAEFKQTARAMEKGNHPILLALRYLRLVSSDTYQVLGKADPSLEYEKVFSPQSKKEAEAIFRSSFRDPVFKEAMKENLFVFRVNKAISRMMSSGVNTTASWKMGEALGLGTLVGQYESLQKLNNFLFIPDFSSKPLVYQGLNPFIPVAREIPELRVYHGTPLETSYAKILRQNALPSTKGAAGQGLYVAKKENIDIPLAYAGNTMDRVVVFNLNPDARFVDVMKKGEGTKAFELFVATRKLEKLTEGEQRQAFVQELGIDILKYPYGNSPAYVINNSSILSHPKGVTRNIRTFAQLQHGASSVKTLDDYVRFVRDFQMNLLTEEESLELIRSLNNKYSVKPMIEAFEANLAKSGRSSPALRKVAYETLLAYGTLRDLAMSTSKKEINDPLLRKKVFEINSAAFSAATAAFAVDSSEMGLIQSAVLEGFKGGRGDLQVEALLSEEFNRTLRREAGTLANLKSARVVRDGFLKFLKNDARGLYAIWGILGYLNYKAFVVLADVPNANLIVGLTIGTIDAALAGLFGLYTYQNYMRADFRRIDIEKQQAAVRSQFLSSLRSSVLKYDGGCGDLLTPNVP